MARRKGLGTGLSALIPGADSVNVAPTKAMMQPQKSASAVKNTQTTESSPEKPVVKRNARTKVQPKFGEPVIKQKLAPVPGAKFAEISVDAIIPNPEQPRTVFDEDYLKELASSIEEFGIIQPIRVREVVKNGLATGEYELIAGERRLRASKLAKQTTIPAIIAEVKDDKLLSEALIENLHRVNLNPLEVAASYRQLMDDFDLTQEQLSEKIGTSRPRIANTLRLLSLPINVQKRIASGVLSEGHARPLITLKDKKKMDELAGRIVKEGLSVRAVEEEVALLSMSDESAKSSNNAPKKRVNMPIPARVVSLQAELEDYLDTPVKVKPGRKKGQIVIDFADLSDLERLVKAIEG